MVQSVALTGKGGVASSVASATILWLGLVCPTGAADPRISADELRRLQLSSSATVVDVRSPHEYERSHIQGAENVSFSDLLSKPLPRDRRIILYCPELSCTNSARAAQLLASRGYNNVSVLEGGFSAWTAKGFPVQTSAPQTPPAITRLSAAEVAVRLNAQTLIPIDTRPALEYAAGHLPGARSMPLENLSKSLSSIVLEQPLLIYDRAAGRSSQAAQLLVKEGFTVYELTGGVAAWARGQPLEVKKQ